MFRGVRFIPRAWARRGAFTTSSGDKSKKQSIYSIVFYRALRVARIVGVSYGIYQVGYRNGLTDYLDEPEEQQRGLVVAVLSMSNATDVFEKDSTETMRVSDIAQKVLDTAKMIALEDVSAVKAEIAKVGEPGQADLKEQLEAAQTAVRKLSGQWNFYVTNSEDVNAFVTDILPKSIFVNVGLLRKIDPSVDELAMILAHELSHVIHDHNKGRSFAQGAVYVVQLVLFALVDPTGQASFIFDIVMSKLVEVLMATHSRNNEEEADMTGVRIMSKACFNAVEGSNVFIKLGELGSKNKSASWLDTHPSTETRAKYVKEAMALHQPSLDCLQMRKDLIRSRNWHQQHSIA